MSVLPHKLGQHQAEHIILGAGLIGAYLGASFVFSKQKVSLLCRSSMLEKLKNQYKISDYEGNQFVVSDEIAIYDNSAQLGATKKADFLWLTVKCHSLTSSIDDIRECIDENSIILCCQNGVDNHLVIKNAFPHNHVIRVMVPFNVISDKPGHFHRGSEGLSVIESLPVVADSVKWLARQINSSHLPVDISFDMTALQWAKLQLNLGNAVNALANVSVKEMLEISAYRVFIAQLMRELLSITRKKQIKLPKIANLPNKWIPVVLSLPNLVFKVLAQKMLAIDPHVRTSMYWDLQAGRKTEVDFLNAKVVQVGHKLGIQTPYNDFIVKEIRRAEMRREMGKEKGDKINAESFLAKIETINKNGINALKY